MDMDILKNWKEWIELLFPLLVFFGIYLFRQLKQSGKGKQLNTVAALINGEVKTSLFSGPKIQGNYMSLPYHITFASGGRGQPGRMQIQVDYPGLFRVTLSPRGQGPGLEALFVRGKTFDTGDEEFNKAVLVRVEAEKDKVMLYLDNPINRRVITDLFQAGFVSIRFSEKGVLLLKPGNFLEPGGFSPDTAVGDLTLACRLTQ